MDNGVGGSKNTRFRFWDKSKRKLYSLAPTDIHVGCVNKWKWTHLTKYSFNIKRYIFELKNNEYKLVDCNSCHPGTQGKGPTLTISSNDSLYI